MLHLHNGESSAGTLRQSVIQGEHFAFRDALIDGPAPASLANDVWRTMRAQHLSDAYGVEVDQATRDLLRQEEMLASFPAHEEVVLWFEHDLFCQVNLIYLLHWFARCDLGKTKLSLICIGEFPGKENFRGLGELDVEQLASLLESRHEVTAAELRLATDTWEAYCSANPTAIEDLLHQDTSALPFLRAALQSHLARFPSVSNGLGHIEQRTLELIQSGVKEFGRLFPKFIDSEPVYGLGDFQFWLALKQLGDARTPLLTITGDGQLDQPLSSRNLPGTSFEITETGHAVMTGQADFVALNGINRWLGGVHLSGSNTPWRWDELNQRLVETN